MGGREARHVTDQPIPYGRQWINEDDIEAVVATLKGDWLTQGPAVQRFEEALAEVCGAKHAVAVGTGTAALHLACLAGSIGSGHEGITTPITFLASASCLTYVGAIPRFADIQPHTWNIDPADVARRVNERTRALIPVHFAGLPCDLHALRELANAHELVLIEDACHALGATYGGRPIGGTGLADMTCLSFHPVKHVTSGEGGAILTDDSVLAQRLRRFRHHGIVKEPHELERNDGPWYYELFQPGVNGRLSDIHAALGASQLRRLSSFLQRRREIAAQYRQAFAKVPGVRLQADSAEGGHAYHLFVIHLDPARYNRRLVFERLRQRGILCQVHYVPVHRQPYFRELPGADPESAPQADAYYAGALSLPMFPALTDEEVRRVIHTCADVLSELEGCA